MDIFGDTIKFSVMSFVGIVKFIVFCPFFNINSLLSVLFKIPIAVFTLYVTSSLEIAS